MRKTKILATVGPTCQEPALLDALLAAGVDGFRLNFSHGTPDTHRAVVQRIREASLRAGRIVAILGDLSGPKIRCGTFAQGPITLVEGAAFTLTMREVVGDVNQVSVTYPLAEDLRAGDFVLLDDGSLRLRVTAVRDTDVETVVEIGGPLSDHKGINVPDANLSATALTPKDHEDAALARELEVDYLALSFVRKPEDVAEAQSVAGGIPVIAKIEKPEAVVRLESILDVADGIMVARGDLGVELGPEKVPLVQKRVIRGSNDRGKLVITATQMLDSMIRSPRPTRAEAADVANAVLDGSDVLMLSGETASGKYPVESVRMMDSIIREVEGSDLYAASVDTPPTHTTWDFSSACAAAAAYTSRGGHLRGIVVFTRTGRTANILADYRPRAPVLAVTASDAAARRMALQWGAIPLVRPAPHSPADVLAIASEVARASLGAKDGDTIAIVVGSQRDTGMKSFILDTLGR